MSISLVTELCIELYFGWSANDMNKDDIDFDMYCDTKWCLSCIYEELEALTKGWNTSCLNCNQASHKINDNNYEPKIVAPAKENKIIDLSILIDSGIDVEFPTGNGTSWFISQLTRIKENSIYVSKHKYNYDKCRVRQDHWMAWQGGECPLPEGLTVDILTRDGKCGVTNEYWMTHWSWDNTDHSTDIIAFNILGVADGWAYPWGNK